MLTRGCREVEKESLSFCGTPLRSVQPAVGFNTRRSVAPHHFTVGAKGLHRFPVMKKRTARLVKPLDRDWDDPSHELVILLNTEYMSSTVCALASLVHLFVRSIVGIRRKPVVAAQKLGNPCFARTHARTRFARSVCRASARMVRDAHAGRFRLDFHSRSKDLRLRPHHNGCTRVHSVSLRCYVTHKTIGLTIPGVQAGSGACALGHG